MYKFILQLNKFIAVSFMLVMLLFIPGDCLAQESKQAQLQSKSDIGGFCISPEKD